MMFISKESFKALTDSIKEAQDVRLASAASHIADLKTEIAYLRALVSPPRPAFEGADEVSEADAILSGDTEPRGFSAKEVADAREAAEESDRILSGNYDLGN